MDRIADQHAEDVRIYREWLLAEITGPEWHSGIPPEFVGLPEDHMWGTCFNDDCPDGVIELGDVVTWRRRSREGMVTWSGMCHACHLDLVPDPTILGELIDGDGCVP